MWRGSTLHSHLVTQRVPQHMGFRVALGIIPGGGKQKDHRRWCDAGPESGRHYSHSHSMLRIWSSIMPNNKDDWKNTASLHPGNRGSEFGK